MRNRLIRLIQNEAENARKGERSGIIIKMNSLEDQQVIDAFYEASQAGVRIELIIRGICCLRPQRMGLSENITVRSMVGDFLEHARTFYFQNKDNPLIYIGSADMMVRSFDRRIESISLVTHDIVRQQIINILQANLRDNTNSYLMQEDGTYIKRKPQQGERPFNLHKEMFELYQEKKLLKKIELFPVVKPKEETKTEQPVQVG
jgi:polyphosphate kinase